MQVMKKAKVFPEVERVTYHIELLWSWSEGYPNRIHFLPLIEGPSWLSR